MTILVPGATGFVGRHLVTKLESLGHTVVPMGRGVPWPVGKPDAVINCAGEITDLAEMVRSNLDHVAAMLSWASRRGIAKVIHIGSSSEYGAYPHPRREDSPCCPTDLYSATKLAATALCQGYAAQCDMDICVARPFSLYGRGDTARKLIPRLLAGDLVTINSAGQHDWVYIDDFVEGLVMLLNSPRERTKGQIVNFGSGASHSNGTVASLASVALLNASRPKPAVTFVEQAQSISDVGVDWVADTTKVRGLGWEAKTSLLEGLTKIVAA